MSMWNIGANDVSEEAQAYKDRLGSKDSEIAALQTKLMKQSQEMNELRSTLNDTLHKLSREAARALRLDADFVKCSEDLRNEKVGLQNLETTLAAARQQVRAKELENRDLVSTLESISHQSDSHKGRGAKLEHDKAQLEARVRELQANLHQATAVSAVPTLSNKHVRRRSSTFSDAQTSSMERELKDVRTKLTLKEKEVQLANEKVFVAQADHMRVENEKIALERRMMGRLHEIQGQLEEKEEELVFLRGQTDNGREEELLRRVEEDEAKIATLEKLLPDDRELKKVREMLKMTEQRLQVALQRAEDEGARQVELVREKEETLDELEDIRVDVEALTAAVAEKDARIASLEAKQRGQSFQPSAAPVDEDALPHIERLVAAVDRLRAERDALRVHIEFLELEAKSRVISTSTSASSQLLMEPMNRIMEERDSLQIQLTAQLKETDRLGRALTASALVLGQTVSQGERCTSQLMGTLSETELRLQVTIQCLSQATLQHEELCSQLSSLGSLRDELESEKSIHEDTRFALERVQDQLNDTSHALQQADQECSSFQLQLNHLQDDLARAQEELAETESRYEQLQSAQRSGLAPNQQTQVDELNQKILRRTEQIGILQHDNKRLVMNEKLSEERITELNAEVELLTEHRNAMVEDCAEAREARDEALTRVEEIELAMEMAGEEARDAAQAHQEAEEQRRQEITTLIGMVFGVIGHKRAAVQRLARRKMELEATRVESAALNHQQAVFAHKAEVATWQAQLRQTVLALAISEVGARSTLVSLNEANGAASITKSQLSDLQGQLDAALIKVSAMGLEVEAAHARCQSETSSVKGLASRCTELETRLHNIQCANMEIERSHQDAIQVLARSKEELERRLVASESLSVSHDVEERHAAETDRLQAQLATATRELDAARAALAEASAHQIDVAERAGEELGALQAQLKRVQESLAGDLRDLSDKHNSEIALLRNEITSLHQALRVAEESRDEQKHLHEEALDALSCLEADVQAQLKSATEISSADIDQLETEVAKLTHELKSAQSQLDLATNEVDQLRLRLREEEVRATSRQHAADRKHRELVEKYQASERVQAEQRRTMLELQTRLDEATLALGSLREENNGLQVGTTELEAEVQRLTSLTRFLEGQINHSERTIASLKEHLDRSIADLKQSETSRSTTEMTLSLQSSQHEQVVSKLQRELTVLRNRPTLDGVVAELEQRLEDMEQTLRSKCDEIEGNDDRTIGMLKEKKKLMTKVDNLTRKVQVLQSKLATAQAPLLPTQAPTESQYPVASSSTSPLPPQSARPRSTTQPPILSSSRNINHASSTRIVSGPSSLPRPKTPERKSVPTPLVFKARTPEGRTTPTAALEPAPVVAGRKRRAPDDFEECESLPPQGYSAECLPVDENTTPRLRRALQSFTTGFTPSRAQLAARQASPKRPTFEMPKSESPFTMDLTNSPLVSVQPFVTQADGAQLKRSWLGKIRGTSSSRSTTSTSRPSSRVFARPTQ